MRGSFSSGIASERTSLTASLTRRMRSLKRDHLLIDRSELERLSDEVALGGVEEAVDVPMRPPDARERQPGALPDVVVVDFGDGGAEAALQLGLHGEELLPLPLQRPVV